MKDKKGDNSVNQKTVEKHKKGQHTEKQKYQQLDGRDRNENKGKELITTHIF